MERQFNAYQSPRSMYLSIFNSFPVIRTASEKNRRFHVPQPTFLFPLGTPLGQSRKMLDGWCQVHKFARVWALRYGLPTSLSRAYA